MLSGEATNTNFIVFGLTRPGLEASTLTVTPPMRCYNTRISSLSGKFESVEFDNANLLEKKMQFCAPALEMKGKIESVEKMSIDRKGNWNEE